MTTKPRDVGSHVQNGGRFEPSGVRMITNSKARNSSQTKPATQDAWRNGLIASDKGPEKGVANVLHVMSLHPAWAGVLAYDAFFERVTKLRPPPVRPQDGKSEPGEWTEEDTTRTCAWFACEVGFEPSASQVDQAVAAAARRNVVHPVRAYLRALTWDNVARLDAMLATHFGASDTPYTRQVGSRWMISAVARVMQPGCQADCMLVLESEQQGTGKSTGFEALFSSEFFADTGLHIGEKDSYQSLRGKWGYEFGELDSLKGREVTRVKNFVSARVDSYRPSYGRRSRDFPRQIVFCGTTNETQYLVDTSGNRRFWPVRCEGRVDVTAIRRERDQLWAEARVRYDEGAKWHVDTPELRRLCEAEQRERQVEDAWLGLVQKWLAHPTRSELRRDGVTTEDVMSGALNMTADKMNHATTTRTGHVLRELGWKPRQLREGGERVRRYFPPVPAVTPNNTSCDGSGCDTESRGNQTYVHPSHVSHPGATSPVCAHAHDSRTCFGAVTPVTGVTGVTANVDRLEHETTTGQGEPGL